MEVLIFGPRHVWILGGREREKNEERRQGEIVTDPFFNDLLSQCSLRIPGCQYLPK